MQKVQKELEDAKKQLAAADASKQPGGAAAGANGAAAPAAAAVPLSTLASGTPQANGDGGAAYKAEISDLEAKLRRAEKYVKDEPDDPSFVVRRDKLKEDLAAKKQQRDSAKSPSEALNAAERELKWITKQCSSSDSALVAAEAALKSATEKRDEAIDKCQANDARLAKAKTARAEALERQGHEHVAAQFDEPAALLGALQGLTASLAVRGANAAVPTDGLSQLQAGLAHIFQSIQMFQGQVSAAEQTQAASTTTTPATAAAQQQQQQQLAQQPQQGCTAANPARTFPASATPQGQTTKPDLPRLEQQRLQQQQQQHPGAAAATGATSSTSVASEPNQSQGQRMEVDLALAGKRRFDEVSPEQQLQQQQQQQQQ